MLSFRQFKSYIILYFDIRFWLLSNVKKHDIIYIVKDKEKS